MKDFIGFTRRNLLIYFKDKLAILFSLMTSIIISALYLLFLKGTFVDAFNDTMNGIENLVSSKDIDMFVNGILLSGILGSALITIPFSCLQTIVRDRESGIDSDICATPLKRWKIILSYFTSASISSFIMTSLILTIGLAVLSFMGNLHMDLASIVASYGLMLIGSLSSAALFMVVILFFRSTSTSTAFFGILTAAAGFVIGAYIPLSQFSETVRSICNIFPASHMTSLIRNVLLSGIAENIDSSIGGLDNGAFISGIKDVFSFNAGAFGYNFSNATSILYVGIIAALCIVVMMAAYSRTYKRR